MNEKLIYETLKHLLKNCRAHSDKDLEITNKLFDDITSEENEVET